MNNTYKAAIYCRLSKDDEQSGDSVSIETQRMMLGRYCLDNAIEVFDIYVDDGYSGLNFNRPAFKRLIQDLEDGTYRREPVPPEILQRIRPGCVHKFHCQTS